VDRTLRGNSLQRREGWGERERGRPRQKLMDWLMEDEYGRLKVKAQLQEELSRWTFGPAGVLKKTVLFYRAGVGSASE